MQPAKHTLINRLRYKFDNTLSQGPLALGIWLAGVSLIFAILMTVLIYLLNGNPGLDAPSLFYTVLLQAIVPNPVDPKSGPWPFLIVMLLVTFGGLLIFSIFIGIFTNTIDNRVQALRKGRSLVLEKDHTVILGWSPQIFPILAELTIANQNHPGRTIAILADKDKVEMEDEIKTRIGNFHKTRVVCRSGDPMDLHELEIVSPHTARSIIVLATHFENHDAEVIKTALALVNNPRRKSEPYNIVGSLRDPASQEVAQLITKRGEVLFFQVDNLISRITAQTCRQNGLSVVYEELLNFEGDEMYFKLEPSLVGMKFGEALFCYEDSAVIGLISVEEGVRLNPPLETVIKPGDQVIAISQDDNTVIRSTLTEFPIHQAAIHLTQPPAIQPERTLVLGWNRRGPLIVEYLDQYVAPGSEVHVVADIEGLEQEVEAVASKLSNQGVTCQCAKTTSRQVLESLGLETFNHVIILSYAPDEDIQRADSRTMVTLLHLRDLADKKGHPISIVSEIMDIRNRDLIEVAQVDDFIISDRLIKLTLTQLSENPHIEDVFQDLFDPEGSEIYLKRAEQYVLLGEQVNFYTLLEAARQRSEMAIGYRIKAEAQDGSKNFGVHMNPKKSAPIRLAKGDRLILVAEKE